jgi:hypothetical protein
MRPDWIDLDGTANTRDVGGPGPMTSQAQVTVAQLSLFPSSPAGEPDVPPWERRPSTGRGFSGLYLGFLAERSDSVLAALRLIARTEGATVVHCTAGKDRTGVVTALALADAGVERSAIVADYAASADRYDALMRRLSASRGNRELSLAAAIKHRPKAVTMERFLDALAEQVGGVRSWLAAHGWTASDHAALRRKLTGH